MEEAVITEENTSLSFGQLTVKTNKKRSLKSAKRFGLDLNRNVIVSLP